MATAPRPVRRTSLFGPSASAPQFNDSSEEEGQLRPCFGSATDKWPEGRRTSVARLHAPGFTPKTNWAPPAATAASSTTPVRREGDGEGVVVAVSGGLRPVLMLTKLASNPSIIKSLFDKTASDVGLKRWDLFAVVDQNRFDIVPEVRGRAY